MRVSGTTEPVEDRLPYLLCFQLFKTLGHGASVAYFCSFGGQREPEVRKTLRKLVAEGFVKTGRSRWDRRFNHYLLTAKGSRALWRGSVQLKAA